MPRTPEEYKALRNEYKPDVIKFIFLLESPPANGGYFYDKMNLTHQVLFKAMMWCIGYEYRGLSEEIKETGLKQFQKYGCFLVDAVYTPINNVANFRERNQILKDNLPNLLRDLRELGISKTVKIIAVKVNIWQIIRSQLIFRDYNVINANVIVPFPSNGNQNRFKDAITLIKQNNNIESFC
jgi:hypothetical protein